VWTDTNVNLATFDENGHSFSVTSVYLMQEGSKSPGIGPFCEWMPYQKGQAAKTEELEAQLAAAPPVDNAHVAEGCEQFEPDH
jgi:hypothetical protein